MPAAYLELHERGELSQRRDEALARLESCCMCPRRCAVNRLEDQAGFCKNGRLARVASFNLHFGEEAPLVGENGSGTIFFAGCNLGCAFCQNWDISHEVKDSIAAPPEQLAGTMLSLQQQGAHNINFVTPTHVVAQILEALPIAVDMGLRAPLVYNSSGYDSLETLKLLEGVVDIYMPDVKFWNRVPGERYCNAPDYADRAREALVEMHRQVGDLQVDDSGIATRGLLVRHLVMPDDAAGTHGWMQFIAKEISPKTYINVMDQYRPCGQLAKHPELQRGITANEYQEAHKAAHDAGLQRLDDHEARLSRQLWRLLQPGGNK